MTIEGEKNERLKAFCDAVITHAAAMMTEDAGAPVEMVLDRILTFAGAQVSKIEGSPRAAAVFREVADQIDAGLFHSVTGETKNPRKGH
ncbi:hypothetical protein [Agrobacterium vitis]|uniref:hypothetical protein n=1 Tax=Agrobacterium vitis TaxID=373 RepID=UPI001F212F5F|nr:hypothetical protein [Agrobacterium vitis]